MNFLKRFFRISLKLVGLLVLGLLAYTCASVPEVSKESTQVIRRVMNEPLPEVIRGEIGYVESQGWKVWYEDIRPKRPSKGSVILVMGAANDALSWPLDFISNFTDAGYRVIRYDHRGMGLTAAERGQETKKDYSLEDMSRDPLAIMDSLQIKKAHFVGASMGGMISQRVAIDHPERVASLTSIMSSANIFDTLLPQGDPEILSKMIGAVLKYGVLGGKKSKIKLQLVQKKILMGEATADIAVEPIAEAARYNLEKRDGYHFMAARKHQKAIELSGSRYESLSKLNIPVLVVHGKQDPVIPIEHGRKMAAIIPQADSLWLDNMGHDLPDALLDTVAKQIIDHISKP